MPTTDLPRPAARRAARATKATIVIGLAAFAAGASVALASSSGEEPRGPDHAPLQLPADVQAALDLPVLRAYGPRPHEARQISVAGETWTLIPADGEGRCIDIGGATLSCGHGSDVAAGRLAITEIAMSTGDDAAELATALAEASSSGTEPTAPPNPTAAVRRGIAPDGAHTARAFAADGHVIDTTTVAEDSHGYRLSLGDEGDATTIEFDATDGHVVQTISAY